MNIYFLLSPDHNFIKIGKTTQPHKRFNRLAKDNIPFSLYMIVITNTNIEESELHERFAYCHKQREWFESNYELLEYIKQLFLSEPSFIITKEWTSKKPEEKLNVRTKKAITQVDAQVLAERIVAPKSILETMDGVVKSNLIKYLERYGIKQQV